MEDIAIVLGRAFSEALGDRAWHQPLRHLYAAHG